jgi:hypothetical protein
MATLGDYTDAMDADSGLAVEILSVHSNSHSQPVAPKVEQPEAGAPGNASGPHVGALPSTIPRPAALPSAADPNAGKDKSSPVINASDEKSSPHSNSTTPPGAWVRHTQCDSLRLWP